MNLLTTFAKKTIQELVIILESGDDYTKSAKDAALTIIELREIDTEELKNMPFLIGKIGYRTILKVLCSLKRNPKVTF